MDSEISERIVLEIVTNLNTRFVVIPLRSETVGDVRGTIKSYHMKLFPTWGVVDVNALEVEVRGNKCRIADPLSIEHLFWRASRAAIFAELIPLSSNTLVNTPRPNLAGATEPSIVSGHELRQNPAERTPSPKKRGLAEGQLTPDPGASSYSDLRKLGLDQKIVDGRHGYGCKSEVVEGQLRKMKRGIDELGSPCDAGERQIPAECATVDVREPATKKSCFDRAPPVLEHIEPETRVPTDKHSVKKSLLVVESTTRFASCVTPDNGEQLQFRKLSLPKFADGPGSFHQSGPPLTKKGQEIASSSQDGSRSRSETDHPVAENLPAEPGLGSFKPIEDSVRKTLKDLGTKHNSSSSDTSDSDSQSDHPLIDKLEEEPGLATSKPDREDIERNLSAAEASPESSSSQSGTRTGSQNEIASGKQAGKVEVDGLATPERRVPAGGRQTLNGSLEIDSKSRHSERHESDMSTGSSSGGSSDETTGQNEDSGDEGAELQGNHNSSSDDSSAESDGEEGSKFVRPKEESVGNDSDQTTSDGDSSLQSSEGSESENIESSSDGSDESDQIPPTGRNMDFTTPEDGTATARSVGRRRFGASVDPKYQHLLDSQNGFDELISLSQLKSKVISGFQQGSHVPLADDSLSIDLVPDTQGGELNGTSVIPEVQKDLITAEPVESNIKDTKLSTQESSTVRISVIQIEEKRAVSIQDGGEDGDRLQCRSGPLTSVKLGEASLLLSVKEELVSSAGGIIEKALELDEEPPQARSDDSQQVRAAVQLARMSVQNGVDADLETPSKKRKRGKKGISSLSEATLQTNSKKLPEESSQHEESPISVLGDLFHEGHDQRLEANRLLTPDKNMPVAEVLGNVLPALEANEVITKPGNTAADENQVGAQFNHEVASDDFGRKKQRKRSRKVSVSNTEVPDEDIIGPVKTVEDELSHGRLDRPDNTSDEAGKENSGKTPSFEYRDLRKRRNVAIDDNAVEKIMSGLKRDKVPKILSRNESEGAEEEQAGLQKQQRLTGWVCTLCNPSVPFARQAALTGHIQKAHNLEKRDIPRELVQKIERETDGKVEVENSSRSKKQSRSKKGRDSNQNRNGDPSAFLPQEVDLVSDKRLQAQDKEEEEVEGEEDRLVLEDEADEESPVVLNEEKKKGKKVGQSSKSAKKARNMETPLILDEDQEMPSTFAEKTKRRRDKLKVPKKQSEAEVAEEIEQLDNPTVIGTDDEQPTDRFESDRRNPNETSLKKKRKKSKNRYPSVEGRNSEGELPEGHQVEPVDDEDQIATQQSQKVVSNANQKGIVGKAAKKSRKKKLQEEVSLHEEAGVSLQTKKVSDAKISDKMTINSKSKKRSEGNTGHSTKRKANGQLQADQNSPENPEHCPHGCGKEFLKKTSAYYRHQKSCVLGRTPNFG